MVYKPSTMDLTINHNKTKVKRGGDPICVICGGRCLPAQITELGVPPPCESSPCDLSGEMTRGPPRTFGNNPTCVPFSLNSQIYWGTLCPSLEAIMLWGGGIRKL